MKIDIVLKDEAFTLQGKNFGITLTLDDFLGLFPFPYRTVIREHRTPWGEQKIVNHFVFDSLGCRLSVRGRDNSNISIISARLSYIKDDMRDAFIQSESLFDGSIQINHEIYQAPFPVQVTRKYHMQIAPMHVKGLGCCFLGSGETVDSFTVFLPS